MDQGGDFDADPLEPALHETGLVVNPANDGHAPAAGSPKPACLRHDVHCAALHTGLFRAAVKWSGAEAARSLWKPKSVGLFEGECRNMRILLFGILLFALCSPAFAQDAG